MLSPLKMRAIPCLHFKANLIVNQLIVFSGCTISFLLPTKCKLIKKKQNFLQKNELLGGEGKETLKVTETNIFFFFPTIGMHAVHSMVGKRLAARLQQQRLKKDKQQCYVSSSVDYKFSQKQIKGARSSKIQAHKVFVSTHNPIHFKINASDMEYIQNTF